MNKVEKIKKLADAMYNRMQNLTTDTSGIRKAMDEYHQFIINEYYKEDTEKDFGIKNIGTVWHDANNVPTKKELCLIMYDSNNGLTLNNVEVVIANPLARRFVTCLYPHKTDKQYTVQGETPIHVDVYHSCRDYIPFSDVDKWAYISDLFNLNNTQEEPVSDLDNEFNRFLDDVEGMPRMWHSEEQLEWGKDIARHFAQWQKQQDQSTIELAEDHAMLAGMEKMKQEMMKDAIDAEVINYTVIVEREMMNTFLKNLGLKTGDKVKMIIIREE